jgi:hypothetical protein
MYKNVYKKLFPLGSINRPLHTPCKLHIFDLSFTNEIHHILHVSTSTSYHYGRFATDVSLVLLLKGGYAHELDVDVCLCFWPQKARQTEGAISLAISPSEILKRSFFPDAMPPSGTQAEMADFYFSRGLMASRFDWFNRRNLKQNSKI